MEAMATVERIVSMNVRNGDESGLVVVASISCPTSDRMGEGEKRFRFAVHVLVTLGRLDKKRPRTSNKRSPSTLKNVNDLGQKRKQRSQELAAKWEFIQGKDQWDGLLNPLDAVLREEIIKYGEFVRVNYTAFDKCGGSCHFTKEELLDNVDLKNSGYEVTKFLYTTDTGHIHIADYIPIVGRNPSREYSNWAGFIAVATDEEEIKRLGRRDIVISWRGTKMRSEWFANLRDILTPTTPTGDNSTTKGSRRVKVEEGFYSLYKSKSTDTENSKKSASEQVREEIRRLVEKYPREELSITITGHSLGGALATLSAYDLARNECNLQPTSEKSKIPITVFTFAAPRVGNCAFRDRLKEFHVNVLRVVNGSDLVPRAPGLFVNEHTFSLFSSLEEKVKTWMSRIHSHSVAEETIPSGGDVRIKAKAVCSKLEDSVSPWLDMLPWTYTHVGVELRLACRKKNFVHDHSLDEHLRLLQVAPANKCVLYRKAAFSIPATLVLLCGLLCFHLLSFI